MPSGCGLTARCPTSRGSSWFHVLCPTSAWCHQRGHCCGPQDILGSRSHSPLGPPTSLVTSACRCRQGSHCEWRVAGGASVQRWVFQAPHLPQVVHMASRELRALLEEPEAAASPLLCLSQSGPPSFLRPVTVQLPLPPGVTGERWPGGIAELMGTGWRGLCSAGEPLPGTPQPVAPSRPQA